MLTFNLLIMYESKTLYVIFDNVIEHYDHRNKTINKFYFTEL